MSACKPYPSNVSDEEWAPVAPCLTLLPEDAGQREHPLQEVFDGLHFLVRYGVAWRVSNMMDVELCLETLEEALARYGRPEISNTDQGSRFSSPRFTGILREADIRIFMDGRARWMDNMFVERLWRSLRYECVYTHAFETGSELQAGLMRWIGYYNAQRPHSALAGRTPDEAYVAGSMERFGCLAKTRAELTRAAKPPNAWGPPHLIPAGQNLPPLSGCDLPP
jgi:hypothetical protein